MEVFRFRPSKKSLFVTVNALSSKSATINVVAVALYGGTHSGGVWWNGAGTWSSREAGAGGGALEL